MQRQSVEAGEVAGKSVTDTAVAREGDEGRLALGDSSRAEKWTDSRIILVIHPTEVTDDLDMRCEGKEGTKDDAYTLFLFEQNCSIMCINAVN